MFEYIYNLFDTLFCDLLFFSLYKEQQSNFSLVFFGAPYNGLAVTVVTVHSIVCETNINYKIDIGYPTQFAYKIATNEAILKIFALFERIESYLSNDTNNANFEQIDGNLH